MTSYRVTGEDLQHIRSTFLSDATTDAELRRASVILRRFMVDNELQRAWRAAGFEGQPTVVAPDLESILPRDKSGVVFAYGGGARVDGVTFGPMVVDRKTPGEADSLRAPGNPERQWRWLQYVESPCIFVQGAYVNRRELVKYFSNRLGGAHLELSGKVRKKEKRFVGRMESLRKRCTYVLGVGDRDAMWVELQAVGQAIGKSEELARLQAALLAE